MTRYRITRYDASTVECRVFEEGIAASYELRHIPLHSPTGFNCGYAGSGPADLALALLTHFFKEDPEMVYEKARNKIGNESRALDMHQRFKQDVMPLIQIGDGETYFLTDEHIRHWLNDGLYSVA